MMSRLLSCILVAAALLGLASAAMAAETLPRDDVTSFTFAFVTDTHIVTTDTQHKNHDRTVALTKVMKDVIRRGDVDILIHGGDATESVGKEGELDALEAILRPALGQAPEGFVFAPIPGNHDVGGPARLDATGQWLTRMRRLPHVLPRIDDHYGFMHKGAAFYVLNTFAYDSSAPLSGSRAEQQLLDMDRFFSEHATTASVRIVCGHAPLFLKSADEPNEYFNVPKAYREKLLELMSKHRVQHYLSGHLHRDEMVNASASADRKGPTVFVQTALSFQLSKTGKSGYYLFTLNGDLLKRQFVPLAELAE